MTGQRVLAVLLTVGFFALVIVGAGALFATFGMARLGYALGIMFCLTMAISGWRSHAGGR